MKQFLLDIKNIITIAILIIFMQQVFVGNINAEFTQQIILMVVTFFLGTKVNQTTETETKIEESE